MLSAAGNAGRGRAQNQVQNRRARVSFGGIPGEGGNAPPPMVLPRGVIGNVPHPMVIPPNDNQVGVHNLPPIQGLGPAGNIGPPIHHPRQLQVDQLLINRAHARRAERMRYMPLQEMRRQEQRQFELDILRYNPGSLLPAQLTQDETIVQILTGIYCNNNQRLEFESRHHDMVPPNVADIIDCQFRYGGKTTLDQGRRDNAEIATRTIGLRESNVHGTSTLTDAMSLLFRYYHHVAVQGSVQRLVRDVRFGGNVSLRRLRGWKVSLAAMIIWVALKGTEELPERDQTLLDLENSDRPLFLGFVCPMLQTMIMLMDNERTECLRPNKVLNYRLGFGMTNLSRLITAHGVWSNEYLIARSRSISLSSAEARRVSQGCHWMVARVFAKIYGNVSLPNAVTKISLTTEQIDQLRQPLDGDLGNLH